MRIVSQDGTIDLPYELTSVFMDNTMTQISAMFSGQEQTMAMYPNEEKCRKVLKMLRDTYYGEIHPKAVELSTEEKKEIKKMIANKYFHTTFSGELDMDRVHEYIKKKKTGKENIVFRFPKGDDV